MLHQELKPLLRSNSDNPKFNALHLTLVLALEIEPIFLHFSCPYKEGFTSLLAVHPPIISPNDRGQLATAFLAIG